MGIFLDQKLNFTIAILIDLQTYRLLLFPHVIMIVHLSFGHHLFA